MHSTFRHGLISILIITLLLGFLSSCSSGNRNENRDSEDADTNTSTAHLGCDESDFLDLNSPVNIMFLQDISRSMHDSSKWTMAQDALTTILESWSGPEFHFGYDLFPPLVGTTYEPSAWEWCNTTPADPFMGNPGVAIDCGQFNQEAILDLQSLINPDGGTPLWCAMNNFLEEEYAPSLQETDVPAYLVLISDGEDNCGATCAGPLLDTDSSTEPDTDVLPASEFAVITTSLLNEMNLKTFVIGFGYDVSQPQLDAIAAAGGTELTGFIEARDRPALIAAFDSILTSVRGCRFAVDPDLLDPDPTLNNLYLGNDLLELVPTCTSGRGWSWNDDSHSELSLCPQSCNDLQNSQNLSVRATFGCVAQILD